MRRANGLICFLQECMLLLYGKVRKLGHVKTNWQPNTVLLPLILDNCIGSYTRLNRSARLF